jgi:hypothetical protein
MESGGRSFHYGHNCNRLAMQQLSSDLGFNHFLIHKRPLGKSIESKIICNTSQKSLV